jgi:hypothetical protein
LGELAVSAAAARRASATLFARTGFVHGQGTTTNLLAVEGRKGGISLRLSFMVTNAKPRVAGHAVHHRATSLTWPCCSKILKIAFRGLKGEIANV